MNAIAGCFVSEEDFPEWCKVNVGMAEDSTYQQWRKNVGEFRAGVEAKGGEYHEVAVKPSEYATWCKETGRTPDGSARATYAVVRLNAGDPVYQGKRGANN